MKEMLTECRDVRKSLVFIVDRWFSSTCAYTLAKYDERPIELVEKDHFTWPPDLLKPLIVVILRVDSDVRRARVMNRAIANNEDITAASNQWDNDLQNNLHLANRVYEGLLRVEVERREISGDADEATVLSAAEDEIKKHL